MYPGYVDPKSINMAKIIDANPVFSAAPGDGAPTGLTGTTLPGLQGVTKAEADAIIDLKEHWDDFTSYRDSFNLNNPPSNFGPRVLGDIKTLMADPALVKLILGGNTVMTRNEIGNVFSQLYDASVQQTNWSAISGNSSSVALQNGALLAAVEDLAENWTTYGMQNHISLTHPPAGSPPQMLADLKTILANPALVKMLQGSNGFTITRAMCAQVAKSMASDVQLAAKAFEAYEAKHPDADPASRELVRQASDVMAYATLISTVTGGPANGHIKLAELQYIADHPAGFPANLVDSAKLFAHPGLFKLLDVGGIDSATEVTDGICTVQNIQDWMSMNAPVTSDDFVTTMSAAADFDAVSSIDISGLGPDVLTNPQKYTGQQKAAVLNALETAYGRLVSAHRQDLHTWNDSGYAVELNKQIQKLSQDHDVASYLATAGTSNLQSMIQGNGGLSWIMQTKKTSVLDGSLLHSTLLAQPDNRYHVDIVLPALTQFNTTANFVSRALGTGGQPLQLNLQNVGLPADRALITEAFQDNVENAHDLIDLLDSSKDPVTALTSFTNEIAAFAPYKPWLTSIYGQKPETADQALGKTRTAMADALADNLLDSPDTDSSIKTAFGDSTGKLDIDKLQAVIDAVEKQDPSLFTNDQGTLINSTKIVRGMQAVWELVVNGTFSTVDLKTLKFPSLGNQTLETYLGAGGLHAIAALLSGAVLGLRSAGSKATPIDRSFIVSAGTGMIGNILNSSTKFASTVARVADVAGVLPPGGLETLNKTFRMIGSWGDMLGAVGGAFASGYGILLGIQQLQHGQKVLGALNIASSVNYMISSVTWGVYGAIDFYSVGIGAEEGASSLLAGLGLVGELSGALGAVFAITGVVSYFAINAVKKGYHEQEFYNLFIATTNQFGIHVSASPEPGFGLGPSLPFNGIHP